MPSANTASAAIKARIDAAALAIEPAIDAIALLVKPAFDAIALAVQVVCALGMAIGRSDSSAAIITGVDLLALAVELAVNAVALAIQVAFNAIAFGIQMMRLVRPCKACHRQAQCRAGYGYRNDGFQHVILL
jgi:hypothetical protein